mgnify:FL=1
MTVALIFCVEDDAGIREIETYTLKSTGFAARGFADGASFFEAIALEKPSLVLLDVMLPGEDGVEILKRLKAAPATCDIPVIMATAKGMEYDKVQSLDLGADDYLTKPFGMMEMVSRVRAVLRRCHTEDAPQELRCGGLCVNRTARTVTADGETVVLTYKEFELLCLFLENPGTVFTRDRLFSEVWGESFVGETRTVDMHIRTLRQKLGTYGDRIETVRGVGYKLLPADAQV